MKSSKNQCLELTEIKKKTFKTVKSFIKKHLAELKEISPEDRINNRIEAFSKRGVWK